MVPLPLLSFFFIYSVTVLQITVVSGSLLIWIRQFCPFFTCRDHINQKLRRDHMLQWNQCTYNLLSQFLLLTIHKSINNVNQYHSPNLLPVHMVGVKCSKRMHLCTLCMQCDFVTNSNTCRQIKKNWHGRTSWVTNLTLIGKGGEHRGPKITNFGKSVAFRQIFTTKW